MTIALELKQLTKTYPGGVQALRGIDLQVEAGDFYALLGPNGAGKSTLMDIIAGRLAPTSGSITVGQTVKIGYFSQHSEFPDSSQKVLEYIKEANNYIETADGSRISAAQMLERFLFPQELQWVPLNLLTGTHCSSGGNRKRSSICAALMRLPSAVSI